jgi:hypothetical protein
MKLQLAQGVSFLRRDPTWARHMTSIGISRLVVSKTLNHAEPGITEVHDWHSCDTEKRAAPAAWNNRVEEIIGTSPDRSKIVPLCAGA